MNSTAKKHVDYVGSNCKLEERDAGFERSNDQAFFAHMFDGIGTVKRMEQKEQAIVEYKAKRLQAMREMREVCKKEVAEKER